MKQSSDAKQHTRRKGLDSIFVRACVFEKTRVKYYIVSLLFR